MAVLLRIVYFNDILIPAFSIFCNLLLLWLIKTVKTKTLIHINYSLAPNSIIDIILSIITFVVAPHIFQIEGNLYIVVGDFLGSVNFFNDKILISHFSSLFLALIITSMVSITVSFYVRYLVICKYHTVTIQTMIVPYILLFIIFLISYLLFLWFYLFENDFSKTAVATLLTNYWREEFGRDPMFVANAILSTPFIFNCSFLLTVFSIEYALIYYYSRQISKTLKTHIDNNSTTTKLLHKQIQRTLFIQAFGPSLIGSIPILLLVLKSFLKYRSTEISLFLSLMFPWVSIANPLAAFIIIKPYRNHLKIMLNPFKKHEKNSKIFITAQKKNFTVAVT